MDLLLALCLLAHPTVCRDEIVAVDLHDDPMPLICEPMAGAIVAQWSMTHPQWDVRAWRCGPTGKFGRVS